MLPCIDKEGDNGLFAERLGGLQSVQTLHKYEARPVRPNKDRRPQALVENARRDLVYSLLFERSTSLGRNVDVSDWDGLALHMDAKVSAEEHPDVYMPLFACIVDDGTSAIVTDGGFASSDILVIDGAHTGCRGTVVNENIARK